MNDDGKERRRTLAAAVVGGILGVAVLVGFVTAAAIGITLLTRAVASMDWEHWFTF